MKNYLYRKWNETAAACPEGLMISTEKDTEV